MAARPDSVSCRCNICAEVQACGCESQPQASMLKSEPTAGPEQPCGCPTRQSEQPVQGCVGLRGPILAHLYRHAPSAPWH